MRRSCRNASIILILSIYVFAWLWTGPSFQHVHHKPTRLIESNKSLTYLLSSCNGSKQTNTSTESSTATIYFLETSGRPTLNKRQLCAVESAAKANPGHKVVVALLGSFSDIHLNQATRNIVDNYKNVRLMQLDLQTWLRGTPFSPDTLNGRLLFEKLNKSKHKVSHTSDVLRFATVYKNGGIYLDLDCLVTKSFINLRNTVGFEDVLNTNVASGVLIFDKHHPFLADVLEELLHNFDGQRWASNGPRVVTHVLRDHWCTNSNNFTAGGVCRGVTLLPRIALFPIRWQDYRVLFDESPQSVGKVLSKINHSYIVHWSNKMSEKLTMNWKSEAQPISVLASTFCPLTSENAKNSVLP